MRSLVVFLSLYALLFQGLYSSAYGASVGEPAVALCRHGPVEPAPAQPHHGCAACCALVCHSNAVLPPGALTPPERCATTIHRAPIPRDAALAQTQRIIQRARSAVPCLTRSPTIRQRIQ